MQTDIRIKHRIHPWNNSAYDDTIIAYSGNEMLNSMLSFIIPVSQTVTSYVNVSTGKELPYPILSLCTILSNALENSMCMHWSNWNHLQMGPAYSFTEKNHILFHNWKIPERSDICSRSSVSTRNGHGIGVRSIYLMEQLHEQCHFSIVDHCFCPANYHLTQDTDYFHCRYNT